jgi:Protein tyrosine and serine/threonine kinase
MWYMFSGEQPFPGLHPKKMAEALSTGIRPTITPNTPSSFAKLIAACWNSEPGARPPVDTIARILSINEAKLFAGVISFPPYFIWTSFNL